MSNGMNTGMNNEMNNSIFVKLSDAVVGMDEDEVEMLCREVINEKIDAFEAIDKGLSKGMSRAGELFEEGEYFVPELLICADAMNKGINVLRPYLKEKTSETRAKIIIGVIEGDTHDIGKNLVRLMLEAANYNVVDLGRDVPAITFVDRAIYEKADMIMISSLMTTTMEYMADVIRILNERGIRDRFKVAVGGGPVSQNFADKIGADGYSGNAADAVRMCRRLIGDNAV